MLEEILRHLNNWFLRERHEGAFTVEKGGLALPFLQVGQYFRIVGSIFNDGLHRYPAEDLTDEAGQCPVPLAAAHPGDDRWPPEPAAASGSRPSRLFAFWEQVKQERPIKSLLLFSYHPGGRYIRARRPRKGKADFAQEGTEKLHRKHLRWSVVEARGVEPLSENPRIRCSPSAVCALTFPPPRSRRQDRGLSSFIKSHPGQSLAGLVPRFYDAGDLRRGRLKAGAHGIRPRARNYSNCQLMFKFPLSGGTGPPLADRTLQIPVEAIFAPMMRVIPSRAWIARFRAERRAWPCRRACRSSFCPCTRPAAASSARP